MKTNLTQQEITQYQEQGFLLIEEFLDADEVEKWREETGEAVRERRIAAQGRSFRDSLSNLGDRDSYISQVFEQSMRLADTHQGVRELMEDPRLGEVAGRLSGVDGIRIWHDQALTKPPHGNPTAWHLDIPRWSFSVPNAISIWVALDDATLENGCLWYLPGTHLSASFEDCGIGVNMRDIFKHYPEWEKLRAVACPCKAGGAIFHNGLTAHGAGANMTPGSRRAMTCAYMPDGAIFNGQQGILPRDYFETLQPGDVLKDNSQNPLIWSAASNPTAA